MAMSTPELSLPLLRLDYLSLALRTSLCLATLAWVTIHPNVPPRGHGPLQYLWRRIKLTLWTLVAPEFVLFWAYRQWAAARHISILFKDEDWTMSHAHFLIMGGFTLVQNGTESVLNYESFLELDTPTTFTRKQNLNNHPPRFNEPLQVAFPLITAAEMNEKARGDLLSRLIAILQSTWFIVQCVTHHKQGLALTEVELVTLASASLIGIMYFFWWHKPLHVQEPIKVYPVGVNPASKHLDHPPLDGPSQKFCSRPLISFHSIFHQISLSQNQAQETPRRLGHRFFWFFYLPIYWFIHRPITIFIKSLSDIATTTDIMPHATHVPTFYAPPTASSFNSQMLPFPLLVLITVVPAFGTSFIAWQFHFTPQLQQTLWRTGAVAFAIIPSASLVISMLINAVVTTFGLPPSKFTIILPHTLKTRITGFLPQMVGNFVVLTGLVAYMLARFLLLSQVVLLMRNHP